VKVGVRVEGGAEAARGGVEMGMLVRVGVGVGVGVGLARGRMAMGVNVGVRLGLGEGAVRGITNARERGTPTMRMCVEVVDALHPENTRMTPCSGLLRVGLREEVEKKGVVGGEGGGAGEGGRPCVERLTQELREKYARWRGIAANYIPFASGNRGLFS